MSKLAIINMKKECKIITIFICFLLVSSIYIARWKNDGSVVGMDELFSFWNGSAVDIGTTPLEEVQNRPVQPGVSRHAVQLINQPVQTEKPVYANEPNQQPYPEAFDVILSAYKHSGSSITGKVLGGRPDAFYVYEPLWKVLRDSFYKGPDLRCLDSGKYCINLTREFSDKTQGDNDSEKNLTRHYKQGTNQMLNKTLGYLQSIFQCSFHNYVQYFEDPETNTLLGGPHSMVYFKGKNWGPFKSCIKRNTEPYERCWKETESVCRATKHRVIKLLRMSLDNLAPLLQENSRLKVIYLYRDPRGIYNSQHGASRNISKTDKNFNNTRQVVKSLCDRMHWDLTAGKELKANFPGRVKIIQYESLGDLLAVGRDMYAFLGMSYSDTNEKELVRMATPRGNKGFHPFKYRTNLSWDVVTLFETECAESLDKLGYTRYQNEKHLRDMSKPGLFQKNALS